MTINYDKLKLLPCDPHKHNLELKVCGVCKCAEFRVSVGLYPAVCSTENCQTLMRKATISEKDNADLYIIRNRLDLRWKAVNSLIHK